jgi:hypothetical protein
MPIRRVIACALLITLAPLASGDVLLIDEIQASSTSSHLRPNRGASMTGVEAQFGAPTQRAAAVGEPPITRWDYPGFSVYFEHQLVIHAVPRH